MGWFTVFAYAVAALLVGFAALKNRRQEEGSERRKGHTIWLGTSILFVLLCLNKQLDLQSLATDVARVFSKSQGWYGERRAVQRVFVLGVLGAAGTFALWFALRFRVFWLKHALLVTGLFFTLTFIVVRAVSFHHVDEFLGSRLAGVRMNWLLELTGIFLVALAAAREIRRDRTPGSCPSFRRQPPGPASRPRTNA